MKTKTFSSNREWN